MKTQTKRAMAHKAKTTDSKKATPATASQKSRILARLTMVEMIGMTAQTILNQEVQGKQ